MSGHGRHKKGEVRRVSDALDAAVMADNLHILNPSTLDTIIGYTMQYSRDEGDRKNYHI